MQHLNYLNILSIYYNNCLFFQFFPNYFFHLGKSITNLACNENHLSIEKQKKKLVNQKKIEEDIFIKNKIHPNIGKTKSYFHTC